MSNFTRHKYFLLGLIFLIGLFLRFYNLSGNPPSLNWDEVSNGYNAYSILKTGKDEYGNFLPLSIRSFDDYKPPLYAYLTVPSIVIFGLNEFSVRFPSALLGSLSVLVVYALVVQVLKKDKKDGEFSLFKYSTGVALTSALLFAISPWSLQFSRAAYEGNIGLFFLLAGVLCLYKFLKRPKFLIIASILLILSMYSYHSFRLIVPIFLFAYTVLYFKELLKSKYIALASLVLFGLLVIPIYSSFLLSNGGTGSRLSMVTIFGDTPELQKSIERLELDASNGNLLGYLFENRRFVYILAAVKGYLEHYNPGYLFIYGDGGVQHHAVDFGMLYLFSLPFILFGVYILVRNINKQIGVLLLLMFLAPLASSISSGAPHPVRAIIMAPVFDIWFGVGLFIFGAYILKMKANYKYVILGVVFISFVLNILYYFHQYYIHTPREYGYFWQYGNKEAVLYAKQKEEKFEKIIMSYKYDQPYVFYLFYNKIDPVWYQKNWNFTGNGQIPRFERKIGKYEFRKIEWGQDQKLKNTLIIAAPDEVPETSSQKIIYFPDGTEAYRIIER